MVQRGILVLIVLLFSCTQVDDGKWKEKAANAKFLHRSIKAITDRIVHDIFSPPVASRIYAYTAVAAYESARYLNPELISMTNQLHGLTYMPTPEEGKTYCYELASVEATLKVGRALIFSESDLDVFYNKVTEEFRQMGIPKDVYNRSIAFGDTIAQTVLAWSGKDNYKQSRSFPKYTILNDPDTWKPTPPAYMDAVEPHWNKIRTMVIDSASQFKPDPPVPFSIEKGSEFYKQAEEVYTIGKSLTKEQEEIARFWDCNPFIMNVNGHVMFANKKISPGGHWINITRVACQTRKADFATSAEAYVHSSIALFDAFISCWDEKYRSKLIRPETYINQYIDEDWLPLLQTPPFPEHTSGHSTISGSASTALTHLFGDNFAFTDSTEMEYGMPSRSFNSFLEASREAATSRLYGGIHYKLANEVGYTFGKQIGEFIENKISTRKKVVASSGN